MIRDTPFTYASTWGEEGLQNDGDLGKWRQWSNWISTYTPVQYKQIEDPLIERGLEKSQT